MAKEALTPEEIASIERITQLARNGTYYDVLAVEFTASGADIEAAYFRLVRLCHPDHFYRKEQGAHAQQIQDNFVEITRAYRALKDDASRALYDRELQESGRTPNLASVAQSSPTQPVLPSEVSSESSFEILMHRQSGQVKLTSVAPTQMREAPPRAPQAIQRVREQLLAQLHKAKGYFDAGQAEAAQGQWARAESSYYLATRYDTRNKDYAAAHREAAKKAKQARAVQYLALAEQAESYARYKEAVDHLRKAVEAEPAEGTAYFKLGKLLREQEDDLRGAVDMFRRAVGKDPRNLEWRLALGEAYESQGLKQNAAREARAALEVDPRHDKAKALLKRVTA